MRVGLIDIDGHNFPNLALMKISAYHKRKGNNVEFVNHFFEYDIVYKSKIFTFSEPNGTTINAKEIIQGGIGYNDYHKLPENIEHITPDYSLYSYPHALGFLTRGCIRNCSFCIVPEKEGSIKPHADITEFLDGRKTAILMDNNVLASDWGIKQIEKIISLDIKIDFNQGLDAKIIAEDPTIAKLLARVKWLKPLRMACDHKSQMDSIRKATELLRKYGATRRRYFVYMLVTDIKDAHERALFLDNLDLDPFAQPLITDAIKPTKEQKRFARWVNRKEIFRSIKYEKYIA